MRRLAVAFLLLVGASLPACSCQEDAVFSASGSVWFDPAELDFGQVIVGDEKRETITLRNESQSAVSISTIAAVGGLPAGYDVQPPSIELGAGETRTVELVFAPPEVGIFEGRVQLVAAGADNEIAIRVTGEGVERRVGAPDVLDFGDVALGDVKVLPLPITSGSELDLDVEVSIGGADAAAFRVESDGAFALAPGETKSAQLGFLPRERRAYEATALVKLCEECAPSSVRLIGNGASGAVVPVPEALDFGTIPPGTTKALTLRVENHGDFPAQLGAALIGAGSDAVFTIVSQALPLTLGPGEGAEIEVRFAPILLGSFAGAVRIPMPSGEPLFDVPLMGRGGGVDIAASPGLLDYGLQPVGVPFARRVVLSNVGEPGPLTVSAVRIEGPGAAAFRFVSGEEVPVDINVAPKVVELSFTAPVEAQSFPAELVIESDDPDEPILRVPLNGSAVAIPPCDLRVTPGQVRFGLVTVNARAVRDVHLTNRGMGDCLVWDVDLDPAGSSAFHLVGGIGQELTLPPGAEVVLEVSFEPLLASVAMESGAVTFQFSNELAPPGRVPLSAFGLGADLIAVPNPVDFGRVPLNVQSQRTFDLVNRGGDPVTLDLPAIAAGSSADFGLTAAPSGGTPLPSGGQVTYEVGYAPGAPGLDEGQVEIWLQGVPLPLFVDLRGEGANIPCGELCADPTAICPGDVVTDVNTRLTLIGRGTDPNNDPLTCSWRIVSAPVGSSARTFPPNACNTFFTPDLVGDYTLELTVRDPAGQSSTCQMHITANPRGGLWVESFWDLSDDIDLHLLHPSGGAASVAASWMRAPWDCYFGNLRPSWDVAGTRDDPSLDRDDIPGTGPENIRIDDPVVGNAYAIGLHWYSDANNRARVRVTTNIYCGGLLNHTEVFDLSRERDLGVIGTVTFTAPGQCAFTPDGTVLNL